jgi:hypothetical protein
VYFVGQDLIWELFFVSKFAPIDEEKPNGREYDKRERRGPCCSKSFFVPSEMP